MNIWSQFWPSARHTINPGRQAHPIAYSLFCFVFFFKHFLCILHIQCIFICAIVLCCIVLYYCLDFFLAYKMTEHYFMYFLHSSFIRFISKFFIFHCAFFHLRQTICNRMGTSAATLAIILQHKNCFHAPFLSGWILIDINFEMELHSTNVCKSAALSAYRQFSLNAAPHSIQ